MTWLIFALLNAILESAKDVLSKKSLKVVDPLLVSWSMWFYATPVLAILLAFEEIPEIKDGFYTLLILDGVLDTLGVVLFIRALRASDLSLVAPIVAFTPLFMLVTAPLISGEHPSLLGVTGVLLIVVGSYILNLSKNSDGFFGPLKAILSQEGPRLMLQTAFVWSFTANIHKVGMQTASPIFWGACVFGVVSLFLTIIVFLNKRINPVNLLKQTYKTSPIGLIYGTAGVCFFLATASGLVTYVISVKRTSSVFNVLMGHYLFKEPGLKERLSAVLLMVAGVVCITFGN